MKSWQKWLMAIPFIAAFSLGMPALAAGELWWFTGDWANTLFVLLIAGMWLAAASFVQPERRRRRRGLTRVLISVGFVLLIPVAVYERTHGPAAVRSAAWSALGLALCTMAIPLGFATVRTLGRFYVPDPDVLPGQELATDGVYRTVRHPMYSAALLWVLGFPLVIRSLWGVIVSLLLVAPALWLRIREEEAMLLREFGDEYREYQARTWRVIPFVF